MKIKCSITSVQDCGETIEVGLQGLPSGAADWRRLEPQQIRFPMTEGGQAGVLCRSQRYADSYTGQAMTHAINPEGPKGSPEGASVPNHQEEQGNG